MKKLFLCGLIAILLCGPVSQVKAFDKELILPTVKAAVINEKIQPKIKVSQKTSIVNPWMYIDVKLDANKSKNGDVNYAEKSMSKFFQYLLAKGLSLHTGDYYFILNNGYVVDKDNRTTSNTREMLKKEILQKDFYKGDTMYKIVLLNPNNKVKRTTCWRLIDLIDLPAGSSHTLNKKYTVGVTKTEQIEIGQTFGLKFSAEINASAGFDFKYASAKIDTKLSTELNSTASKNFTDNREIKSLFESNTNVSYNPSEKDRAILRYQLVDNYKVDAKSFRESTLDLEEAMNANGEHLVKLTPAGGNKGIDVPTDEIFDVTIDKQ
ncbi:hypothetical protein IRP63_02770 [Clostridium botulinum]|uniref:Uncharacterized protein n=1 Tax=Clostridium botulinum C/D str. DC5 TaxID=1443128 RepID=A0A0A0IEB0_CLOBO|nr:hypothetical protein [Clostridium botulinum]KEI06044.1 hypothetical protein Z952_04695 [Clostridium botulinum C/D str. BKT75002]KEI06859.1 hypothetical protein Z954_05035 [Clostridium botulinum C/D str. BKT2873]KGM95878.1 hypothetical protein Z956_03800 [Clostridium botulinum D str. CCUG 7971]KGM99774.1 hypothetical protein Z955_06040 [Clostridium botulinum C/D str. DC5]KOC47893.1 hypothetical protein ADU88_09210 [Clostridium botulinum]